MDIKILIVDDHAVVRIGLTSMFEGSDIRVVAEASDGESAFEAAKKHRPNVVLLDVRMPNGDGIDCLARIKFDLPHIPVLMFSGFENPTNIARAVALGAAGFLSKAANPTEIMHAIRAASRGETIWSQSTLQRVRGVLAKPKSGVDAEVRLTQRESEVLKQLALGLTNKEIAQSLSISYPTVKEHVKRTFRKLGVTDRTQAAIWAVRRELI